MKRYFCTKCGSTLSKGNTYAVYNAYGLKELRCTSCATKVVSVEYAIETMWKYVKREMDEKRRYELEVQNSCRE